MTMTKSPVSTCGAKIGLCLPRRSTATWLASRPSTTSDASMTCHCRVMSLPLGLYVRTVVPLACVSLIKNPRRGQQCPRWILTRCAGHVRGETARPDATCMLTTHGRECQEYSEFSVLGKVMGKLGLTAA